jgi:hypothetical protein
MSKNPARRASSGFAGLVCCFQGRTLMYWMVPSNAKMKELRTQHRGRPFRTLSAFDPLRDSADRRRQSVYAQVIRVAVKLYDERLIFEELFFSPLANLNAYFEFPDKH